MFDELSILIDSGQMHFCDWEKAHKIFIEHWNGNGNIIRLINQLVSRKLRAFHFISSRSKPRIFCRFFSSSSSHKYIKFQVVKWRWGWRRKQKKTTLDTFLRDFVRFFFLLFFCSVAMPFSLNDKRKRRRIYTYIYITRLLVTQFVVPSKRFTYL